MTRVIIKEPWQVFAKSVAAELASARTWRDSVSEESMDIGTIRELCAERIARDFAHQMRFVEPNFSGQQFLNLCTVQEE